MNVYTEEQGSITVVALLVLVVLTILGITLTRSTTLDLKIGTNELVRKQRFYVAEGGVYREAAEVGEGSAYVVANVNQPYKVAAQVIGNATDT
ncbi:MAG: PilX N-terminal domain-containing pilus assembly protein, partial [Syntrophobacterales bacterium]